MFDLSKFDSVNATAAWGVNLAIKALILLTIAFVVIWLLRRSSAALRHQVVVIAVIITLLLPLLSIVLPDWNLGLIPGFRARVIPVINLQGEGATPDPALVNAVNSQPGWNLSTWLLVIWLCGTSLMLIRLFAGRLLGMRTVSKTRQETDQRLNDLLEKAKTHIELDKSIMLLRSPAIKVPVIYGSLFPRLLVPEDAREWSEERLEAIFIHELSHIKRFDILTQTVAQVVCCLHWFNPLAWIIERRLMIERERACDDMVLLKGKRASEYAKHLMESAGALGSSRNPAWAMVAMAEGTDFKDRVLSILDPNARRDTPKVAINVFAAVLASLILVPFVSAQPFSDEPVMNDSSSRVIKDRLNLQNSNERQTPAGRFTESFPDQEKAEPMNPASRLLHGLADLVEDPENPEKGKEFASEIMNSIADLVPEDEEGSEQLKQFFNSLGDVIRYSDSAEMAKQEVARMIRSIGNLTEQQKEELARKINKEIDSNLENQ